MNRGIYFRKKVDVVSLSLCWSGIDSKLGCAGIVVD